MALGNLALVDLVRPGKLCVNTRRNVSANYKLVMNDKKRTMVIGVQTFSNILVKQQTEIILLRKSAQLRRCKRSAPVSLYKPED